MLTPRLYPLYIVIIAITLIQCTTPKADNTKKNKAVHENTFRQKHFQLAINEPGKNYSPSDSVVISWKSDKAVQPDSVIVVSDRFKTKANIRTSELTLGLQHITMGQKSLRVNIYSGDSLHETHFINLNILATEPPKELKYKVIREIWHDNKAYTQGLLYTNGFLYESTGKNGESSLRKIDLQTGKVLKKKDLPNQYFGEGIALVDKHIFMLTYRARIGFVFDMDSFEEIRKFDFQSMEGWGLTFDGKHLIMSDGSSKLSYYQPEYLSLEYQVEVCSNTRPIGHLNELEHTPIGIFANVYTESVIVLIDPKSGAVKAILDLSALFPAGIPNDIDHVLNGIAWNPDTDTYYVTGKYWPVMYEIKIFNSL